MNIGKLLKRIPWFIKLGMILIGILGLVAFSGLAVVTISPATGAYGVDFLRQVFGDQAVAGLETMLFQAQDATKQVELKLDLLHPDNPFGQTPIGNTGSSVAVQKSASKAETGSIPKSPLIKAARPGLAVPAAIVGNSIPSTQRQPVVSAARSWHPGQVMPFGTQTGEGVWQAYLQDSAGNAIAYRTFLTPDPTRPYAQVAVVAFDLQQIRLHYVIGFQQPYAPDIHPYQPGRIPNSDLNSDTLLAAFNGGFKYMHGKFGSMSGGFVSVPPRDGLGTVAMYSDGSIKIGSWGDEIKDSAQLVAYRQNGPLVIQNGTPTTQVDNSDLWGRTLSGGTVTWRSGLGISADGKTLYYFAGPSLSIRTLADAMMAVHPVAAMQLDINNFWVHFVAIHSTNGRFTTEPLFPKEMNQDISRYLDAYSRDFFYVTTK